MKPTIASLALCIAAMAAFGQGRTSPVVSKAQADFDKVDAAPVPTIQDAMSCAQSNAAAAAAVKPEERYLFQFRKGYCELFGAASTGNSDGFRAAATDFTDAIFGWPIKTTPGPPSALPALVSIAHLEQGRMADSYPDLVKEIESVTNIGNCAPTPIMSTAFCSDLLVTARVWLGWLAYRANDLPKAAANFSASQSTGWNFLVAARIAQQEKRFAEAADLYQKALDRWTANEKSASPDLITILGPKSDPVTAHFQLGVMAFETERYAVAIPNFDAVFKLNPKNSYAIFLRARSKEGLQQVAAAIDDYALAIQAAHAYEDTTWNVGQASFYRGRLLFKQRDFMRAEVEFATALTLAPKELPAPDIAAWRSLAHAWGTDCEALEDLDTAVRTASDQFPKAEAAGLLVLCRTKKSPTLETYLTLEKQYAGILESGKLRDLRNQIASAYADQGVAAEDRKDIAAAIAAYRHSIDYNPVNPKARFNLGAIYIEQKSYDLAEEEYRALVMVDPNDFEAQYWVGQSILAQRPAPERVADACGFLRRSTAVPDPQKKAQFSKALAAAKCQN